MATTDHDETPSYDAAYTATWALSPEKQYKNIYVSKTTIHHIKTFMQMNGLNPNRDFSKTIEFLALSSLQDTKQLGFLEMTRAVMERTITRQYNRFAKMLSHTAIEAGAAKEAAQQVFFMQLLQEQLAYEELLAEQGNKANPTLGEFEGLLTIDPNSPTGKLVKALFNKRKGRFRHRSVKALKSPLPEFENIHDLLEMWGQGLDEREEGRSDE